LREPREFDQTARQVGRKAVPSESPTLLIVAVLALVVVGALLEAWWRKLRTGWAASKAAKRGLKAERDAEKLLKKLGYTLVARQVPAGYSVLLDGDLATFRLTADLLVESGGKRHVAEVKTGKAIKLDHAETRRQLLEYQLAFGVDSLLLVDMEGKKVHTVRFPLPKKPTAAATAKRMTVRWAAIALLAGGIAWFASASSKPESPAQAAE
jgi:Holliday junction resolvase